MAFTPEQSAIKVDSELERALEHANHSEIAAALRAAALRQKLVTPDPFNESHLNPTPLADNAPSRLAERITVDGQTHIVEGSDPASLLRAENYLLARLMAEKQPAAAESQPRNERGQFVSAEDAALEVSRKAELELKFKRGEISTDEWLAQSGAIERHLASQGISVDDLKRTAESGFESRWKSATDEFLARHPEWQGGPDAVERVGEAIAALGLQDQPSLESLEAAYAELIRTNRVPENRALQAEAEFREKLAAAKTADEVHQITSQYFGGSRSLLGR